MTFDINTARPVGVGFQISTAKPIEQEGVPSAIPTTGVDSDRALVDRDEDVGGVEEVGTFGKIFDVPAATARAAMRESNVAKFTGPFAGVLAFTGIFGEDVKKEAQKAALFPSGTETFQEEFVNKAIDEGQGTFKELYPESVAGVVSDMWADPAGALLDVLFAGAGKTLKALKTGKKITKATEKVTKAIKPSIAGKTTRKLIEKSQQRLGLAVDTIVDNANNINYFDETGNVIGTGVPKNLDEFSSAITQTKSKIFDEYSALAQQADVPGVTVPVL